MFPVVAHLGFLKLIFWSFFEHFLQSKWRLVGHNDYSSPALIKLVVSIILLFSTPEPISSISRILHFCSPAMSRSTITVLSCTQAWFYWCDSLVTIKSSITAWLEIYETRNLKGKINDSLLFQEERDNDKIPSISTVRVLKTILFSKIVLVFSQNSI